MVVRIAGYGYQKGFGGHFHNDNSIAASGDIPGLVDRVAGAARRRRGDDALVRERPRDSSGAVCVFLEPIALYHTRDLYEDGDDRLARGVFRIRQWPTSADRPCPHVR